jgi:BRCT domain type II-containing protein
MDDLALRYAPAVAPPLANQTIVLTGDFEGIDPEDAKWGLISKGARVLTSVTKTTAVVVAGRNPKPAIMAGARRHATPVVGVEALRALLEGATIAHVTSAPGDRGAGSALAEGAAPLGGMRVSIAGKLPRASHASTRAVLERLGATVEARASAKTDLLVLGGPPTFEAIDALGRGTPALLPEDLVELERGAPLARYLGRRDRVEADPPAFVSRVLVERTEALVAIDTGGEVWHDELTLTLHPGGRLAVHLNALGGTPTEDHVRRVLQREDWPAVTKACSVRHSLTFGRP